MSNFQVISSIAYILFTIIFMTIILMQKKRSSGLGAQVSGVGSQNTYWDKNKSNSIEGKLSKYTVICGVIFFIFTLTLNLMW